MVPVPFDGAEGELARSGEELPPVVPVGPPGDAPTPHAPDDESSDEIDAYMAQLLDRVNQRSFNAATSNPKPPAAAPLPRAEPSSSDPPPPAPVESSTDSGARPAAKSGPPTPADASPSDDATAERKRSVPPERAADIIAMRQLAISSARDAIERYSAKRYVREAGDKLMVAVVLGTLSGLSAWTAHGSHIMLGTAVVGFTATAFCLCRAIQLYGFARRSRHRSKAAVADE